MDKTVLKFLVCMNLALISVLYGAASISHAEQLGVSPAVAEKQARDADLIKKRIRIEEDLLGLPGSYQNYDMDARKSLRRIESENKGIQSTMRDLNNSVRDMNTNINRINNYNRSFSLPRR